MTDVAKKDAKKLGPVARAGIRLILGPEQSRRTPGPSDEELRELTENTTKKDGEKS